MPFAVALGATGTADRFSTRIDAPRIDARGDFNLQRNDRYPYEAAWLVLESAKGKSFLLLDHALVL
jgi:hypothetical protein